MDYPLQDYFKFCFLFYLLNELPADFVIYAVDEWEVFDLGAEDQWDAHVFEHL